jgi:hypothetical protein
LFLAAFLLPPFWKIATLQAVNIQDDIFTSDLINDRLPARAFVGESIRQAQLPFWIPGIYTGFPALGQVEIGVLYPSNLVLFGLLSPYAAIAYAQLLPLFIAGLGAFLLAREYGLPLATAFLAAGTFSLSGFFVCHLRQLNMVDAACWIPLLFMATGRVASGEGQRAPFYLALLWWLQLLAGHPQISFYTGIVLLGHFLERWRAARREGATPGAAPFFRQGGRFALALAIGTLAAAAQIIPSIELAQLSHRRGGLSYADAARFPASPFNVWTFFVPYVNGDPGRDTYRLSGIFWEQYGYVGALTMLLAIVALVAGRRNPVVRWLAALAVVSYLMVLGSNTPLFYWAHRWLPGMSYFRFPTRFLVFVDLALAMLGAFGLAHLLEGLKRRGLRLAACATVLAVTAADLWVHQMRQVPQVPWSAWTSSIGTVRFLHEAKVRSGGPWRCFSVDSLGVHRQIYHAARGWAGDLSGYVLHRALLQPSFNLLFDLERPDGYANLVPRHYEGVWGSEKDPGLVRTSGSWGAGRWSPRAELVALLRLFNVRYLLSPWPVESPAFALAATSSEGVRIYETIDPLPRAFVVGRVLAPPGADASPAILARAGFDPRAEAFVHDSGVTLPPDSRSTTDVRIIEHRNLRVVLEASLEKPGLLVLSEGYYPGWIAKVDGRPARIVRANFMMRGVSLAAGRHEVVFEFRPRSILMGFALSAVGILGIAAMRAPAARPPRGGVRPPGRAASCG